MFLNILKMKRGPDADALASPSSVKDSRSRTIIYYQNGENFMENKLEYVKVKIKSLADEAIIIRQAERKQKTKYQKIQARKKGNWEQSYNKVVNTFWGLRDHRTIIVRNEARAAQIAYGFLRGKKYNVIENAKTVSFIQGKPTFEYYFKYNILPRVIGIANKYSTATVKPGADEVENWIIKSFLERKAA